MNKQIAKELKHYAHKVAQNFSKTDREGNFNAEQFKVAEVIPTSDTTAAVIYEKNTGKKAAFFFYYIARGSSKGWHYFVPTDAHIVGMMAFQFYKLELERNNFSFNFI